MLSPCEHRNVLAVRALWRAGRYVYAMGSPWISAKEARQAIPRRTTEHIGSQLLDWLGFGGRSMTPAAWAAPALSLRSSWPQVSRRATSWSVLRSSARPLFPPLPGAGVCGPVARASREPVPAASPASPGVRDPRGGPGTLDPSAVPPAWSPSPSWRRSWPTAPVSSSTAPSPSPSVIPASPSPEVSGWPPEGARHRDRNVIPLARKPAYTPLDEPGTCLTPGHEDRRARCYPGGRLCDRVHRHPGRP